MTETDHPSSRPWADIAPRAAAGSVLLAGATGTYFQSVPNYYGLAALHNDNAAVAVAHALADGRASRDGYPEAPPEALEFLEGPTRPLPSFTPVPIERAEAAVAADAAVASYSLARAAEATTDARLLLSAAGAMALVGFGLLYPLASVLATWLLRS